MNLEVPDISISSVMESITEIGLNIIPWPGLSHILSMNFISINNNSDPSIINGNDNIISRISLELIRWVQVGIVVGSCSNYEVHFESIRVEE